MKMSNLTIQKIDLYCFSIFRHTKKNKMKKLFVSSVVIAVIVFAACTPKTNPSTTATTNPTTEEPKPMATTYTSEVWPLIQSKCTPCHIPSKGGRTASFETYESAKKYGAQMITRIELNPTDRGFMPFKHDKLSADEIALFKKWVADGMQEK